MAIVITNIPNEVFRFYSDNNINIIEEAVVKGILLPDDAKNGDVIKAMFPSVESRLDEKTGIILVKWVDGTTKTFKASWWNTPYKAGDTD